MPQVNLSPAGSGKTLHLNTFWGERKKKNHAETEASALLDKRPGW